jgi:anti-anti-sigma regulatory factor
MARSPAKTPKRKRVAVDAVTPGVEESAPQSVAMEAAVADVAIADSVVEAAVAEQSPMQPVVDASGTAVIALAANCSIKEVATLRERLIAAVDVSESVVIDAAAVERIDTATLQVLYAFVRDRLAGDREVTWQGVPAALTDAARLLGVRDLLCLPAAS